MPQINYAALFEIIYDLLIKIWAYAVALMPILPKVVFWYKLSSHIFVIVLSFFAAYLGYKILAIRRKEREDLSLPAMNVVPVATVPVNPVWQAIKDKLQSDNPADWQWAIIEADKILDEMVKRMGYPGENLGERLKTVEPPDFLTLDEAWEAHKVRNQIAHEPGFQMDKHKAALTISRFEKVFNEFGYI